VPEFYYALFRAGLPANADSLFQVSPKTVQAIWQQAIKQGVIPQSLASDVAGAVQRFQELSTAHTLDAKPPVGISTLREMLQASLTDPGQQQQFAALYVQHRDDLAGFWEHLRGSLGDAAVKQLQLNGQLFYLTLNNVPLVQALVAAERQNNPLSSTLDLTLRGYYEPKKWASLISAAMPIPAQIPGTGDQQRNNYAELLATQVRLSFPTAVVADLVQRGTYPLSDSSVQPADVTKFLTDNQGKFEIGIESIEAFLARTKLTGTPVPVVNEIKRLQRVYQMTRDDQTMAVLLQHNHDSAQTIARYEQGAFVRAFAAKLGGAKVASDVHARAKQIHGAVLNIVTSYLNARIAPTLGGASPVMQYEAPPPNPDYPIIAYPTLEALFGSLDFCQCQECRSILSPAAYLVDLLHYLDNQSPAPAHASPQDVLFARRPDLQYLPLTCENTNTVLPYIDIVNETLEYYVANGSLANYQGHDTGAGVTSDELMASPQYVNDTAYTTLQSSFFPPPLPFNRPLELLRLHMQKIGVALPDVMTALRTDDVVERRTPADYGWRDILMETLGISREEYLLFTDRNQVNLKALYGYLASDDALTILQDVSLRDFSRRTQVSYDDLIAIVKTQFINPSAILIPKLERLNASFATLQKAATDPSSVPQFIASLPAGLDPQEYGGKSPEDREAIVTWVRTNLPRIQDIIVITNAEPANDVDQCDAGQLKFRYTNPDAAANKLGEIDFLKLIRFIRLWRKLGLSIEQTDDALSALSPAIAKVTVGGTFAAGVTLSGVIDEVAWAFHTPNAGALSDIAAGIARAIPAAASGYSAFASGPVVYVFGQSALAPIKLKAADAGSITLTVDTAAGPDSAELLDRVFLILLPRLGFLFQVMSRLDLTADSALARLLACWAPIGTVGTNSLYRKMFLAPAVLGQDPGQQMAMISGTFGTGDVVTTTINGLSIPYLVKAGDVIPKIADGIANAINTTTATDPTTGLPLNSRISASGQGDIITLTAGFTLDCSLSVGATESYKAASQSPPTATVSGTPKAGDVLTTTIDDVAIPYTVAAGDTLTTIAENITDKINNTRTPDFFSGVPVNSLLLASSMDGQITFNSVNSGAPFTLACSSSSTDTGRFTTGPLLPPRWTATFAGPVKAGSVLTTTINAAVLTYTAASDTDLVAVADAIAAMINASRVADPISSLPVNNLVSAVSADGVITLAARDPTVAFTLACAETSGVGSYVATGPLPASQSALIAGTIGPGHVLTTTINGIAIACPTVSGDTPLSIAGKIATAISANPELSSLVSAAARPMFLPFDPMPAQLIVTAKDPTTTFALTVSMSSGSYTSVRQLSPFADDGHGNFLKEAADPNHPTQTLFGHEAALCAACNLTGAEFAEIVNALGFVATSPLDLSNVSAIFRIGWLAHTLRLSVVEFLALRQLSGLDPFAPLDPGTPPLVEPPVIRFIRLCQALANAGIRPVQALYLMWNHDISGNSAPPITDITGLARSLRADFAAVESQFTLTADPDSSIAKGLMALVYGNTATDFFFGLLNNTFSVSVAYSNPPGQATVPQPIIDASKGRLSYDDLRKRLSFAGVLDGGALTALTNAITVNTSDSLDSLAAGSNTVLTPAAMHNIASGMVLVIDSGPAQETIVVTATTASSFTATTSKAHNGTATAFAIVNDPTLASAIANLAAANQQAVGPFFAAYPELLPLYSAYAASADAPQTKRTALLVNFLPSLKTKRKEEQALASITSATGADASFATALMQDPSILQAAGEPTASAITDLTAIEDRGLSVEFFLLNDSSGAPDIKEDAAPAASYAPVVVGGQQTATVGGRIAVGNVLTTIINGISIPYRVVPEDSSSAEIVAGHIADAVNSTTTFDPYSGLPLNCVVSATPARETLTIKTKNSRGGVTLACSAQLQKTVSLTVGQKVPASQSATVGGAVKPGDVLTTTINEVAVPYTVIDEDRTPTVVASKIAAAINAAATPGMPLNGVISASSAADVVTITAAKFGPAFKLACSLSPGATETYVAGQLILASQTATISGVLAAGGVLITTVNGIAIPCAVTATDTTEAAIASRVAAALNAAMTPDPATGKPLNSLVSASSAAGVISVAAQNPGASFTLSCSLSSYAAQFPAAQTATVGGSITPGDVLTTTIDGVPITVTVGAGDTTVTALAANIAAAVNGTATLDPLTRLPIKDAVSASSSGGVLTITSKQPGAAFSFACSTSSGATETYVAGPQFLADQATITGGFSVGDVLTTTISGIAIPYNVVECDSTPAALAGHIAAAINAATALDPVTGLQLKQAVIASSTGGTITLKTGGPTFTLASALSVGATTTYSIAGSLPLRPGGGLIAGRWSGYLDAPQDGFYDITIETDPGASVTLVIGGAEVTLASTPNKSVWSNESPISLTAGALTPILLTVASVRNAVSLSWASFGLGSQIIPGDYLYSQTLVDRLRTTYVRFLKATSLATGISLTSNEIAYLGTATGFRINTVDRKDKFVTGTPTFTPESVLNIGVGSALVIDRDAAQETVTVSTIAEKTFTAATTKPHDSSATPFPIVNEAFPNIGQGWLNFLVVSEEPDPATCASLRDVLTALLDFARIKRALSPNDERLLSLLQKPDISAVISLTGWDRNSLTTLLTRFVGDTDLDKLTTIEYLRRVFDAYAFVRTCRISAATLIAAATNAPTATAVRAFQSALRALYAETDWLAAVRPINDAMRIRQRDALVAYILLQLSRKAETADIETADKLFEFFLIDVETQPPVETSRIRLALSSVQLFIERILRNLEQPTLSPSDIDGSLWPWMKRYRVWQANREVFLWPENWLYPELRDDQSPFFQETMSALLQSDITDDAAASAYLDYLTKLEEVAKLEPCGLYYVPQTSDANEISYVIARTAGAHRKHYFRKLQDGSWTPWTEVKIDCEDMPITPIVWNNRLFLFWIKVLKQTPMVSSPPPAPPDPATTPLVTQAHLGDLQFTAQSAAPNSRQVTVQAILCWSEFYNGKWQPTKTSDVNRPTAIGDFEAAGPNAFDADRDRFLVTPAPLKQGVDGALALILVSPRGYWPALGIWPTGGFVLYNTHSLPVRLEGAHLDDLLILPNRSRNLGPKLKYTGGPFSSTTWISYFTSPDGNISKYVNGSQLLGINFIGRFVEPQLVMVDAEQASFFNPWDAPFFFEDRRNVFYVTTSEHLMLMNPIYTFGNLPTTPSPQGPLPSLLVKQEGIPFPGDDLTLPDGGSGETGPIAIRTSLSQPTSIRAALQSGLTVSYQGRQIGMTRSSPIDLNSMASRRGRA
jgi:hypothetical protein